eukprot:SAG11_NODE_1580_length_4651_cov_5.701011_4_plen_101_part_00
MVSTRACIAARARAGSALFAGDVAGIFQLDGCIRDQQSLGKSKSTHQIRARMHHSLFERWRRVYWLLAAVIVQGLKGSANEPTPERRSVRRSRYGEDDDD